MNTATKDIILRKNDAFRRTFIGGKIILTQSIQCSKDLKEILHAVKTFDNFTPDNDPYNEHDFGKFTINSTDYFFKIDYYDENYEYYKKNGNRVMTIMRAEEY